MLINNLLVKYSNTSWRMLIKIHFYIHLHFSPPNFGAVSDQRGEKFHQNVLLIENLCQPKWDESMMSDYC